jgi:hypothetical protein
LRCSSADCAFACAIKAIVEAAARIAVRQPAPVLAKVNFFITSPKEQNNNSEGRSRITKHSSQL